MIESVSAAGASTRALLVLVTTIGLVILVIVGGAITFGAVRYRARAGDAEGVQEFGNRRLERAWFAVPLGVVIVLFVLSARVAGRVEPPTAGRPADIIVIGHQWWWEVFYPAAGVVTANELHIPAGRKLLLQLESADVIHDFWVPQVGRKMDAVPGHPNRLWIEADRPGTYTGACAEYCGVQHAWMRLRVVARPPAEFAAWLAGQARPRTAPASAMARRGAAIFRDRTCSSCHTVEAGASSPNVGPSLAHVADRATLGAGVIPHTPANLARWLTDPQAIKPGSHMPDLALTGAEVRALVAYLRGGR